MQPDALRPGLRFDYFVRTRTVTPSEAAPLVAARRDRTTYPQRAAVLFALRELTGKDAGETTQAWRELFPRAEIDAEASRLRVQLFTGDAVQQAVTMGKWRAQRSATLDDALAALIPDLGSDLQKKLRDVLVDRLRAGTRPSFVRNWPTTPTPNCAAPPSWRVAARRTRPSFPT